MEHPTSIKIREARYKHSWCGLFSGSSEGFCRREFGRMRKFISLVAPELHEIGHLADHAYGYLSKEFGIRFGGMNLEDSWAEGFGKFYCSKESSEMLRITLPDIYNHFENFDIFLSRVRASR